jgi:RNA polymerase sigma-70 factor, ECF subfamily
MLSRRWAIGALRTVGRVPTSPTGVPALPVPMRVVDKMWSESAREKVRRSAILHLPFFETDAELVAALLAGERSAGASLYDRHHVYVRRVLMRVLGPDADLHDLVQEVFIAAIASIARLADPRALRSWLAGITVNCVRVELRRRMRSSLSLFPPSELPERAATVTTPEIDEAVRATYRVLTRLAADERIPFALRFIDGMELLEIATACGVSLATTKRRLASARKKFVSMARTYPELSDWLTGAEP